MSWQDVGDIDRYALKQTMEKSDIDPAGPFFERDEEPEPAVRRVLRGPRIAPIEADKSRPLISVVIPSYEPEHYLIDAVRSVLAQDPGAATMQIAVVDDGSSARPSVLLQDVAPAGRIEFHESGDNLGLAGNWNRCIALARGQFVHLLHQDDCILPGFYTQVLKGLVARPGTGMAFSRHAFIDETGSWTRRSHLERWLPGLLSSWLARISQRQRIQCPAALVRRTVYESVGGFRPDLPYALDWEMWVRIAAEFGVWYEPRVLACYRRHNASETNRLAASGRIGADLLRTIEAFSVHIPELVRGRLTEAAYLRLFASQLRDSRKLLASGKPDLARRELETAGAALQRTGKGLARRLRMRQLTRLARRCLPSQAG